MKTKQTKLLSICMTEELYQKIKAVAEERKISLAKLGREIIGKELSESDKPKIHFRGLGDY